MTVKEIFREFDNDRLVACLVDGRYKSPSEDLKSVDVLYDDGAISENGVINFIEDNSDIETSALIRELGSVLSKRSDVYKVADIITGIINEPETVTDLLPVETSEEVQKDIEAVNEALKPEKKAEPKKAEHSKENKQDAAAQKQESELVLAAAANMQQPMIPMINPIPEQHNGYGFNPYQFIQQPQNNMMPMHNINFGQYVTQQVPQQPQNTVNPVNMIKSHITNENPQQNKTVPVAKTINPQGQVVQQQRPADVMKPVTTTNNANTNKRVFATEEELLATLPKDPRPDLNFSDKIKYIQKRIKLIKGTHPGMTEHNLRVIITAIDNSFVAKKIRDKFGKDVRLVEVPVPNDLKKMYDFCIEVKNNKNNTVFKYAFNSRFDAVFTQGEGYSYALAIQELKL